MHARQFRATFLRLRRIFLFLALVCAGTTKGFVPSHGASSSRRHLLGQILSFEYCTGCRWDLRSFWMAQELLTTFQDDSNLEAVVLRPSRPPMPGGTFLVEAWTGRLEAEVLWDRFEEGGFPESKELKQRVRDEISPETFLGHSDSKERQSAETEKNSASNTTASAKEPVGGTEPIKATLFGTRSPCISIVYCTESRWLYRAAYLGLELLTKTREEPTRIGSFALVPNRPPAKEGQFTVLHGDKVLWDVELGGTFPEPQEILDRMSDVPTLFDEMDDEDGEEARRYFGVA